MYRGTFLKEVPSTMAITDRNLSIGTQLYARYKSQTYTAEVVGVEVLPAGMLPKDAPADPDPRLVTEIRSRLRDGREFKSPSAAGTAITEKACNGWAFWSVGDGAENTGPVTSTKTRTDAKVTPPPRPQGRRWVKKGRVEEPAASDDQTGDEARDDAPTAAEDDAQPVTCAECGDT